MKHGWLERMFEAVADRGRELLKLDPASKAGSDPETLCRQLLSGRGEASSLALARAMLQLYAEFDRDQKLTFFQLLKYQFGPEVQRIQEALDSYREDPSPNAFVRLCDSAEPPRQELFRRLNTAPNGTASLVNMRADLLNIIRDHPELRDVDADLKHLLSSWFNRGFLQLRTIDWQSPAQVLEKLINYEAVHEIQGWNDLRRRLMRDRRCFAFFHPVMPDEPLIFVEVALVQGIAEAVQPLLDPAAPVLDPDAADTAMFYSINNTQTGLRGISFGNFLIKQVLTELRAELPKLRDFATLSPMPRFASTLDAALAGQDRGLAPPQLEALLEPHAERLCSEAGTESASAALRQLLSSEPGQHADVLAEPLQQLALAYLTAHGGNGSLLDPVAAFHLANGARLERINVFADLSAHGLQASYGIMVNYLYIPDEVEINHERFVGEGRVVISKPLTRMHKRIEETRPNHSPQG